MKATVIASVLAFAISAANCRAELINSIVATVDGEPITLHELHTFRQQVGQEALQAGEGGAGGVPDTQILDTVIINKLVAKETEALGIKARDVDIDGYVDRIKQESNITDEQLDAALAQQGMSMETYRKQIGQEIERAMLINREIGSRVSVTPQDIERYYNEQAEEYSQPEQVRVRHIFLPLYPDASLQEEQDTQETMEDIRQRALAGEDFAALADAYSQGPGAGQGGDLGFFERGQMTEEIESVAFGLDVGEISQPFRTDTGVHLIKAEERREEGKQPLDTVSEEIRTKLFNEALQKRYAKWFQEDLRFRHHVENFLTGSSGLSPATVAQADLQDGDGLDATVPESKEQEGFLSKLWPF